MRWMILVVSVGQISWAQALSYLDLMVRALERCQIARLDPSIVFVYDDILRRQLARRAAAGDPALSLDDATTRVDRDLWHCARRAWRLF